MRLAAYLDKGASLGPEAPCLTVGDERMSYGQVQAFTHRVARGLARSSMLPGAHIAILSDNDPLAFACVFAVSRAGAIWCPINPRNEAAENAQILGGFDCAAVFFQGRFAALIEELARGLPQLRLLVCLDADLPFAPSLDRWLEGVKDTPFFAEPPEDTVMIPGTGGTTGVPKGVMLTDRNLEAMTALTLIGYPFTGRPVYLAMAPLTHAAGVLALPIMALGGEIVVMPKADIAAFIANIAHHCVTHCFLPPTLIYMLLDHPDLDAADLSSLQCFWYGAAPIAVERLAEALVRIGPVMAQLFGQTEAPMMISSMAPADHFRANGTIATERLASAGRPGPLVEVVTLAPNGDLLPRGETGEIAVRGSLVMKGYYRNPAATAEGRVGDWHRTGDIGRVDADGYLFIVDRAKDMIITGGFNVYSAEVEKVLIAHPAVQDCAVFGLPDPKWGERVCAVVQLRAGAMSSTDTLVAHARAALGGVKAPKSIEIWPDLPRSKIGKVLKKDIRAIVMARP